MSFIRKTGVCVGDLCARCVLAVIVDVDDDHYASLKTRKAYYEFFQYLMITSKN